MHSPMIDCALGYTRVSTEEQEDEGLSLDAQVAGNRRYMASQGWAIAGEFQDVMSGTRDDRPDYQRLLAEVRRLRAEGHRVAVVVPALDRLGRKLLEGLLCRLELRTLGVPVHCVDHDGELDDDTANQLLVDAEKEIRRLSRRVKTAWKRATERGWLKTTRAAWGYRWRPRTEAERKAGAPKSVLDVDPQTAPFAREMFDRVARGQSARSVALWAANLPEDARHGRGLPWRAVQRTLHSPVYIARQPGGRHQSADDVLASPVGNWPALVDDETWMTVQMSMDERRAPQARKTSSGHLLTGWLRCPLDGGRMHGGGEVKGRRYRCDSIVNGARCTQTALAEQIEHLVIDQTVDLVGHALTMDPEVRAGFLDEWDRLRAPRTEQLAQTLKRRTRIRQSLDKLQRRRAVATERYVDDNIAKDDYNALIAKIRSEAAALERDLAALSDTTAVVPDLPPGEIALQQAGVYARALIDGDLHERRDVLAKLVERIKPVRTSHAGRRSTFDVDVTWTPLALGYLAARTTTPAAA